MVFEVVLLLLPPMLVLAIPVGGVEVVVAAVHVVVAILEEVVILGDVILSVLIPWTVLGSTWQTQGLPIRFLLRMILPPHLTRLLVRV